MLYDFTLTSLFAVIWLLEIDVSAREAWAIYILELALILEASVSASSGPGIASFSRRLAAKDSAINP